MVRQALESGDRQLSPWALVELLEAYGIEVDPPGRSVSPEATSRLVGQTDDRVALVGRQERSGRGPRCASIASGREAARAHRAMRRVLTHDGTALQGVAIRSLDPQARRIRLSLSRRRDEATRLAVVPLTEPSGEPAEGQGLGELVGRLDELWADVPELVELELDPVALATDRARVLGGSARLKRETEP